VVGRAPASSKVGWQSANASKDSKVPAVNMNARAELQSTLAQEVASASSLERRRRDSKPNACVKRVTAGEPAKNPAPSRKVTANHAMRKASVLSQRREG